MTALYYLFRKEKDLLALADKIEDEQSEVIKGQKQIKEMSVSNHFIFLDCQNERF